MSNPMSNAPIMSTGSTSIFQTWLNALTKPKEQTFIDIASSPNAKATTACVWVFISYLVTFFISYLVRGAAIRERLSQSGLSLDQLGGGLFVVLVTLLCMLPIFAAIGILFFAVWAAVIQWIAKLLGGKGTFDQMAYAFASILVPYSVVSIVFIGLSAIPFVSLCIRVILGLSWIYIAILNIMAVKGVNQFGYGAAIGSFLIPGLALGLVCCCLFVAFGAVMRPIFGNVFSTINQSLNP